MELKGGRQHGRRRSRTGMRLESTSGSLRGYLSLETSSVLLVELLRLCICALSSQDGRRIETEAKEGGG